MRDTITSCLAVNGVNGSSIAILTLTQVKDVVAIALGVVSIISTVIIIRQNLRKTHTTKPNEKIRTKPDSDPV